MLIQLFSKRPLPQELRSTFELPCWPYREGPGGQIPVELRDYLRKYSVFRYEDDYPGDRGQYSYAILIPDDDGVWPSDFKSPINAYQHTLYVHNETLEIIKWPNDRPEGFELHRKIVEGTGDNFAWAEFNKSVVLRSVNAHAVVYISGHNTPGNISNIRQITRI